MPRVVIKTGDKFELDQNKNQSEVYILLCSQWTMGKIVTMLNWYIFFYTVT